MVAYAEAMKIRECCKRTGIDASFEPDEIWVLSVGTGITNYSLAPPRKNAGLTWWAPRLLNTTLLSQSQGTEALANYMIGSPRHHRVNFTLPDGRSRPPPPPEFRPRHHRVNFTLPDESWKLDCVDRLDTLKHIGYRTAHEQLAFVREQFLYEPAVPYTPFGGEPALITITK